MLCRIRVLHIFLFIAVTVLQAGEAVSQASGYTSARTPAKLSSVGSLSVTNPRLRSKINDLVKELRRSPNDPVTLNNLAVAHAAAGQMDLALETALQAVEADRDMAAVRLNLAAIHDRLGQTEQARDQAAEAARLAPENIRARSFLCELNMALPRPAEAADCYRKLISDFPGQYDFQLTFGVALVNAGKLSEARDLLESLRAQYPEDTRLLNLISKVYFEMKDYKKSAVILKEAVELAPDNSRLRYNLGISYLAARNRPAALSQYNLIKESNPELAQKLYRSLFHRYILDVRK